jgi:hypothetical protein
MKSVYTILVIILIFQTLLFAQGKSEEKNVRYFKFYPNRNTENKLINTLKLNVRGMTLSLQIEINNELDSTFLKKNLLLDSTKIYLKSGTNWFLEGLPPKKPILFFWKFFLKHENIDVQKRIDYCELVATYESQGKIPYHLIEKIELKTEIFKSSNKKYLATYLMIPDSTSNFNFSLKKGVVIEMTENNN